MQLKLLPLLFIVLLTWQCTSQDSKPIIEPAAPVIPTPPPTETYTYLALGDSYTIGHSVTEEERFPVQLSNRLGEAGYDVIDTRIIAKTGWTTDELQNGIANESELQDTYQLVSLLIGVNNQYRNRPVDTYKPEFRALLNQAIAFAGGRRDRVFVVSIPDYAYTSFGNGNPNISAGIDVYNAANKEITESYDIAYFDITPISRLGLEQTELVASDGLHPSGEQYKRWVDLMLPGVIELLDKP